MGARSGSNYLSSLKKLNAEVWLGGERVGQVTSHPAFRNCARSVASLYDMQLEHPEQMTYRTDDGGRSGLSFIQPKSIEELRKRSRMMAAWANFSGGMLGRTPDYLNASIAAMAAARDFFTASDPRFDDNIANYYLEARKHDWCGTLALNDNVPSYIPQIVDETSAGIVVTRLMRAPLAPLAEELLVLPTPRLANDASSQPLAIAFAIPSNTKGVKLVCKNVIDTARSRFDAPLASRFAQPDCLISFDHVMVPWERVFLCGDIARCNALFDQTSAAAHMMHQEVVSKVAKTEFILGLAGRIAEVTDAMSRPQVRERIGEIINATESMRECLRAAEAEAAPDQWGVIVPIRSRLEAALGLFAKYYPRMMETVQLVDGPDLPAHQSENDLSNADADTRERAALHRLASDATSRAFAEHPPQSVDGDPKAASEPVATAGSRVDAANLKPLTQRIKDFLTRTD
jgi:4-hydroxyphenylacetate 3-monooxygenase